MEEQALEFLLRYADWVKDATFWRSLWHMFTMWLIRISYSVARFAESVVDQVFKITGFLEEGTINTIYTSMRILAGSILAVTLIYVIYKYLFSDQVDLKGSIFRSIVFLNLIIYLPGLMNSAMAVTKATFDATKDLQETGSSLSYNIVQSNMVDLTYLSKNGFGLIDSDDPKDKTMNLSEQAFKNADLSEIILPGDVKNMKKEASNEAHTEALSYTIRVADDGSLYAEPIKNSWLSAFDDGKFRFSADTTTILISLWTMAFVYLCAAFTIALSLMDLVFARILFPILAAMDVEEGQKVKRIFQDIGNTYATVMLTGLSISIFSVYFSYLSTLSINVVTYVILCMVGVTMSISGPRSFGKYLGIDTSVRGGLRSLAGGFIAAKAAKKVGKAAVGLPGTTMDLVDDTKKANQKVKNGVSNAVDKGKSVYEGAQDSLNSRIDDLFNDQPTTLDTNSKLDMTNAATQADQDHVQNHPEKQGDSQSDDQTNLEASVSEEKAADEPTEKVGEATGSVENTEGDLSQNVQLNAEENSVNEADEALDGHAASDVSPEAAGVAPTEQTDTQENIETQDGKSIREEKDLHEKEAQESLQLNTNGVSSTHEDDRKISEEGIGEPHVTNPEMNSVETKAPEEAGSSEAIANDTQTRQSESTAMNSTHLGEPTDEKNMQHLVSNETAKTTATDQQTMKADHTGESKNVSEPGKGEAAGKLSIWEEKKANDARLASTNDPLKNFNVEDYLSPSTKKGDHQDG